MSATVASPGVIADAFPRTAVRNIVLVLAGAVFIGLSAQLYVYLPGNPVPITGQTFAVLLVAAGLGLARGVSATLLYTVAGVLGVPWFAQAVREWWRLPLVTSLASFWQPRLWVSLLSGGGLRAPGVLP